LEKLEINNSFHIFAKKYLTITAKTQIIWRKEVKTEAMTNKNLQIICISHINNLPLPTKENYY